MGVLPMKTIFDSLTDWDYCADIIRKARWNGEAVTCTRCNCTNVRIRKTRFDGIRYYQCRNCSKGFSDISGTIMEHTHLPASAWLLAAHLMQLNVPDAEIASELGIEENSASRLARLIRASCFFCHALSESDIARRSRRRL